MRDEGVVREHLKLSVTGREDETEQVERQGNAQSRQGLMEIFLFLFGRHLFMYLVCLVQATLSRYCSL